MNKNKKLKALQSRIGILEEEENKKKSLLSKVFDQLKFKENLTEDKKQSLEELDKVGKERIHWIEEISREAKEAGVKT